MATPLTSILSTARRILDTLLPVLQKPRLRTHTEQVELPVNTMLNDNAFQPSHHNPEVLVPVKVLLFISLPSVGIMGNHCRFAALFHHRSGNTENDERPY